MLDSNVQLKNEDPILQARKKIIFYKSGGEKRLLRLLNHRLFYVTCVCETPFTNQTLLIWVFPLPSPSQKSCLGPILAAACMAESPVGFTTANIVGPCFLAVFFSFSSLAYPGTTFVYPILQCYVCGLTLE